MKYLKQKLLGYSRLIKQLIASASDFTLVSLSVFLSYLILRIDNAFFQELWVFISIPAISVTIFYLSGTYRSILRYIDLDVIFRLIKAILLTFSIFIIISISLEVIFGIAEIKLFDYLLSQAPFWSLSLFMSLSFIIGLRLTAYSFFSDQVSDKKVIIYGAGSAGIQLAEALKVSKEMQPIAFLDQNASLHNTFLGGIKILSPKKLSKLIQKQKVDEVLIAMPSASKHTLRTLLKEIEEYSVKVRILPGLAELAQGKVLVSELKEVDISDLLGRYEVEANTGLINKNIDNKVVLITGAGGSIGSEISRQVAKNNARKVILLDANEYALYLIKKELEDFDFNLDVYAVLTSVNNKKRMIEVCETFKVNTIYHAAAYKHVPLVEENPFEAVFNNIQGTKTCAEAALKANVETFVLISTDKAVRPTNIMGATKRFSELILQSMASTSKTRMTMVRFGNVIGSSGSAIPLFQKQIKDGGPVTVTHPEVIRYFMSIPEAAELVIQAGAMGKGGDVFVLDMGEPVKIYELAKRLINLSGMEVKDDLNPQGDIEIIFTGLRPGEKLYEELLIGDNVSKTEHKQIFRAEEDYLPSNVLEEYLKSLEDAEQKGDLESLRDILKKVVSGFTPEQRISDIVHSQKNN